MKKVLLALAIFITSINIQAQTKVGTIDAEYILAQMPEIATVEEGLKAYNDDLQADMQANITKYEELVASYKENNTTFTKEEKTAKESEIISLENDIKNFRQKASVLMQVKRNELTQPLYVKIDEAMKVVIAKDKYTQIFNASGNGLAYSDAKYDITDAVMKTLGIELPKE
ncbi:periplasmic chaperone for outer membrane proteins Skp [Gillisia mitskevichiae]|uniref:Periplasmic chaperone for outer membrane proteins Skp n=1 Tax=Gillisia mitskevichiae TaxID=270921 RepID=A0A495NY49_9FLAO|nr:OmpH family outer membrane protein [Gillisia mitskevichiae]RKS43344.1 periplasmic chaperone for outer membrane proteins Skp [Gillisia mitskevichiae]